MIINTTSNYQQQKKRSSFALVYANSRLRFRKRQGEFQLLLFLSHARCLLQYERDYLDNAFKKSARENQRYTNNTKRPIGVLESPKEAPKPPPGSTTKRMRLSDALQVTDEEAAAPRSSDTASGSRTSPSLPTTTGENTISKRAPSPTSRLHRDIGIEIPMKKFQSNSPAPTRTTRSRLMSRQTPTTLVW